MANKLISIQDQVGSFTINSPALAGIMKHKKYIVIKKLFLFSILLTDNG